MSYLHVGVPQTECDATLALYTHSDISFASVLGYHLEANYVLGQPQEVKNPECGTDYISDHGDQHGWK